MQRYINDLIGEDYLNWKPGETVAICSQTGSGKSTFILRELLPHAIECGKKIVYLCNRKILDEQLVVEAQKRVQIIFGKEESLNEDELSSIYITTYQHCEEADEYPNFKVKIEQSSEDDQKAGDKAITINEDDVLYYVFDESHYFLSDSLFNRGTNYWSNKDFNVAVSIFLTATPEPLQCFFASRNGNFDKTEMLDQILARVKERAKMRVDLSKSIDLTLDFSRPEGDRCIPKKRYTKRQIDDKCRAVKPYECVMDFVSSSISRQSLESLFNHTYVQDVDYSDVNPAYFKEYSDLLPLMLKGDDRWLVLVDNKADGIDLVGQLKGHECSAVFLSAQNKVKKDSDSYEAFQQVVQKQVFDCRVLVATSVLDCGVSIDGSKVRNIVVAHSERTEFLQMLGRLRIKNHETINLFMKYYNSQTINSFRHLYEEKIVFMAKFNRLNRYQSHISGAVTSESDEMEFHSALTSSEISDVITQMVRVENVNLVCSKSGIVEKNRYGYADLKNSKGLHKVLDEYEISKTALVQCFLLFKNYAEAVEIHRVKPGKVSYLKRQLSWIGKTYDVENWVGNRKRMEEIISFLDKYVQTEQFLDKKEQVEFATEFFKQVRSLPLVPKAVRNDVSRYQRTGTVPGKKKLSDIIEELGVPFRIESKQSSKDRKTQWRIVRI